MNVLSKDKQAMVIGALAEGNSIRSIERLSGIHRDTIMRLGVRVGEACHKILDQKMRGLNCSRIEIDEMWGFIGKKGRNTTEEDRKRGCGHVWTFMSIDPITKLIPSHLVGLRDRHHLHIFFDDLAGRLNNRIQLSSDGLDKYRDAVESAFGANVDYGQIVKEYSTPAGQEVQRRYSPGELRAVHKTVISGKPNFNLICTSYIERANLTMRTHCKRLARLTLAFSKKLENFKAAIALNLAYYNFVKIHGTLRCTPAMAAGVESSALTVGDLVDAA